MKNESFQVDICQENGCVTAIINPFDKDSMNWCASTRNWGGIFRRKTTGIGFETGNPVRYCMEEIKLESLDVTHQSMKVTYVDHKTKVTVDRFFTELGNLRERYCIKNISPRVCTINRDTFGVELPFRDSYPSADECMTGMLPHACLVWREYHMGLCP